MTYFSSDPDAHVVYPITDALGGLLDFEPVVRVDNRVDVPASWLGEPGSPRDLRVPLNGLGVGLRRLRLIVPGDSDVDLGDVILF